MILLCNWKTTCAKHDIFAKKKKTFIKIKKLKINELRNCKKYKNII